MKIGYFLLSIIFCSNLLAALSSISGSGVPSGGTTNQVLKKLSNADGDADWLNEVTGVPSFPLNATTGVLADPPSYGFSGGDNDTGIYSTGDGNVSIQANGTLKASFDQNTVNLYSVSGVTVNTNLDITGDITANNYPPTGTIDSLAHFNGSGVLSSLPNYYINSFGFIGENITYQPNAGTGGFNLSEKYFTLDPLANTPNESQNFLNLNFSIDPNSTGFDLGTSGQLGSIINLGFSHQGTSDIGQLIYLNMNSDIGNGTDPFSVNGISYVNGIMNIDDNVTITNQIQGYGFQPNMAENSVMNNQIVGFYDFANIQTAVAGYTNYSIGTYVEEIKNNTNYNAFNINPTVDTFTGNAQATLLAVSGNYGTFGTGTFNGMLMNPTVTSVDNAYGIWVSMDNVTSANKKAAYFDGDVEITGALAFGGALSTGSLNSFGVLNPVTDGGGNPSSVNSVIAQINIPASATTANADTIGINTAMLLTVGASSAVTLGPLGLFTSLALPTVIETHTSSVLPAVQGGVFALNFSGTSTGGTVNEAAAGRFVMIPNGITTIDESIGVKIDNPFGNPGTVNYGVKQLGAEKNFFDGNLETALGVQLSTSATQPTCAVGNRGLIWNIEGGTGVADVAQICQKDSSNAYVWNNI